MLVELNIITIYVNILLFKPNDILLCDIKIYYISYQKILTKSCD